MDSKKKTQISFPEIEEPRFPTEFSQGYIQGKVPRKKMRVAKDFDMNLNQRK